MGRHSVTMNCSLGVNAFRPGVQAAAHHFSKACSRLLVAAAPTTRCFSSTTLLPSTVQNQWQTNRGRFASSTPFFGPSSTPRIAVRTLKFAARNRVIIHYVDLPPNYKDEEGLPFRVDDLAAGEVLQLFGPGMTTPAANRLLKILHGRRVAGTLDDPVLKVNTAGYTPKDRRIALDYLRKNVYVDEVVNAGLRAEDELAALEKQQEEDAQAQTEGEDGVTKQLGYKSRFKMYQEDAEGLEESEKKKPEPQSVYGKSAFDAIRARNEATWKEKLRKQEEERKKLEEYKNGKAGRWKEAEKLEVQVMETSKAKLGAGHPYTLRSMANLALTYMNQGRWEEAEKLNMQVMETSKARLGADHLDTLTSMGNLALIYMNQGRWEEAEKLEVQVMEISKAKLGADHPSTVTSMANLASTLWNQGRWEEAEKLGVQVMETFKTKLGADHPDTLTSMANLAFTWNSQGRHEDALALMQDCVEARQRVLGPEHPNTLSSLATVSEWSS